MKTIKNMESITEKLAYYCYIGSPHIRTDKFNGLTAFRTQKVTECIQCFLLSILADPKQAAAMFVNLVHTRVRLLCPLWYCISSTPMAVTLSILRLASPHSTTHVTASATISQETRNDLAVSVHYNFLAQNARNAANCFVTGDLPVAHGTCSTTTLPQ